MMKIPNYEMWKNVDIELLAKMEKSYADKVKLINKKEVFGLVI